MGFSLINEIVCCIPWLEALSRKSQDNDTLEKTAVIGSVANEDIPSLALSIDTQVRG
jgi:hypothetical protein